MLMVMQTIIVYYIRYCDTWTTYGQIRKYVSIIIGLSNSTEEYVENLLHVIMSSNKNDHVRVYYLI